MFQCKIWKLNTFLTWKEVFKNASVPESYKKFIQPPIRVALNKDTIYDCLSSITKTYAEMPHSKYTKIRNSLFWGFAHDSIIKFGMDRDG